VETEKVPNGLIRQIHGVNGRSVVIDTLRKQGVELADPPLLPLSLGRVHFARWMKNPDHKSATLEARGIFFGEIPPHLVEEMGLSRWETLASIAREDLRTSIALNPRRPTALMFLGIVLGKEGEFRAADEAFTKSIRLNDKNSLAYFQRGLWRIRGGQIELAIQDLEKTMELDPMNVAAWTNLIRLKAMLGEQKPR
jgi:tetratricopeptide (TPR) repeat protein